MAGTCNRSFRGPVFALAVGGFPVLHSFSLAASLEHLRGVWLRDSPGPRLSSPLLRGLRAPDNQARRLAGRATTPVGFEPTVGVNPENFSRVAP